jgi:hypothetical protein
MMRYLSIIWFLLFACETKEQMQAPEASKEADKTLFTMVPAEESKVYFINTLKANFAFNILEYNYFYNGSGVAVGDVNRDGLQDLFLGGNMVSSRLYLNRGNFRFEDITEEAKLSTGSWITGVSMVDINLDGWPDIYACVAGYPEAGRRKNLLFVNQQNGTFREQAAAYGLDDEGYSTQATWLDYDRDGDLDMYLLTHFHDKSNPNVPKPKTVGRSNGSIDRLYENRGMGPDGHPLFQEVSEQAGIVHEGYGLGVAVDDFNQDGWPDIYVSNDFIYDDLLYINQQDGTFRESAADYFKHSSRFAMGTDAADFNNDLWPDILTLDMLPDDNRRQKLMNTAMNYDLYMLALERGYLPQFSRNSLQMNNGRYRDAMIPFSEIGQMAGVFRTDWSWSALWADYDNDGNKDLLVTNGIPKDITDSDFIKFRDTKVYQGDFDYDALKRELLEKVDSLPGVDKSNFIFSNDGDLTFSDMTSRWGLRRPSFSNGAAYADLDNDGDLDLVMNNINGPAFVYRNESDKQLENHALQLQLAGAESNPSGIGSKIIVEQEDKRQYFYQAPARGFQSWVDERLHIGLGNDSVAAKLTIIWPDQKVQVLRDVTAGNLLTLDYENASEKPIQFWHTAQETLVQDITQSIALNQLHRENDFADFKLEPLLPHKLSQSGPGLAVGDINGDGLDDFWTGGAHQQPGHILIQQESGEFLKKALPDEKFEDVGGLLFDADQDGDKDLYVVSGGSEFNANTAAYQDRLYLNDGEGNFTRDTQALPRLYSSGSCVSAADFDKDGDLDLFVGGRLTPATYPAPPRSYLLRNEGGIFKDVTQTLAPQLSEIGMVTAALWTDVDNDAQVDLMLAGEWLPVTYFKNEQGKFTNQTEKAGLSNTQGWWNSLYGADFDRDGDIDYVAGNLGLNTPLKASASQPVKITANDYDRNGSVDAIISYYRRGLEVPFVSLDPLVSQLVMMRKRFPSYTSYADAGMHEVLTSSERQQSYRAEAQYMQSAYLENQGNGKLVVRALPNEAQIAPVYGINSGDFNQDGHLDIIAHGNSYATEFVTGQYDALRGLIMLGDGKGNFTPLKPAEAGFVTDHDGTALSSMLGSDGKKIILAAANNDKIRAFRTQESGKVISLDSDDYYAILTDQDGNHCKVEFYYGEGYLSQSGRKLFISEDDASITIFKTDGSQREITF